jgi:hypothetical protein
MEGEDQEYWAPERRERGLPKPLIFVCGGILVLGFAGSVAAAVFPFGSSAKAEAETTANAPMDEDDGSATANVSEDLNTAATEATNNADAALAQAASDMNAADSSGTDENASAAIETQEPAYALISCRVQGMALEASRCIAPTGDSDPGGFVRISGGGSLRRYGPNEVYGLLSGSPARIPLAGDYAIAVQANGDSDYTLRMEVYRGSQRVYQNEGSSFDTLSASAGSSD